MTRSFTRAIVPTPGQLHLWESLSHSRYLVDFFLTVLSQGLKDFFNLSYQLALGLIQDPQVYIYPNRFVFLLQLK